MEPFSVMVLGIVFLGTAAGTIHKYLDHRLGMAEHQARAGDRSVLEAIEELRAEMTALRRHETDAILGFDSTLQTLDTRLKQLERRALGEGVPAPGSLAAATRPSVEAPTAIELAARGAGGPGSP